MSRFFRKLLASVGAFLGLLIGYLALQMTTPSPEKTAGKCRENMAQIAQSLEKYKQQRRAYPTNIGSLGASLPTCPCSGLDYSYGYAGGSGNGLATSFTIYCSTTHKFELGSKGSPK